MSIRCGVAGWSYPDWDGVVYPKPKPKKFDPLDFMAGVIDAIEINSTFYHPGSARNAESWARRASAHPGFKFTVKLWRKFTHQTDAVSHDDVQAARAVPEILAAAGVLGAVLLQFPFSFHNTAENRGHLIKTAEHFTDLGLALEVRHESWDRPEFFRLLEDMKISFVNLDQPIIGKSLPPKARATAPVRYIRLHGRNYENWFREGAGRDARYDYLYSLDELGPWAERAKKLAGESGEVYVITNNHYKGQAVVNALQLIKLIGDPVTPPPLLAAHYPGLLD